MYRRFPRLERQKLSVIFVFINIFFLILHTTAFRNVQNVYIGLNNSQTCVLFGFFLICQWYLCLFVVFLVLTEVNNV